MPLITNPDGSEQLVVPNGSTTDLTAMGATPGDVAWDTTAKALRVDDGLTPGGRLMADRAYVDGRVVSGDTGSAITRDPAAALMPKIMRGAFGKISYLNGVRSVVPPMLDVYSVGDSIMKAQGSQNAQGNFDPMLAPGEQVAAGLRLLLPGWTIVHTSYAAAGAWALQIQNQIDQFAKVPDIVCFGSVLNDATANIHMGYEGFVGVDGTYGGYEAALDSAFTRLQNMGCTIINFNEYCPHPDRALANGRLTVTPEVLMVWPQPSLIAFYLRIVFTPEDQRISAYAVDDQGQYRPFDLFQQYNHGLLGVGSTLLEFQPNNNGLTGASHVITELPASGYYVKVNGTITEFKDDGVTSIRQANFDNETQVYPPQSLALVDRDYSGTGALVKMSWRHWENVKVNRRVAARKGIVTVDSDAIIGRRVRTNADWDAVFPPDPNGFLDDYHSALFYRIIGPPIMAILRDFVSGKVSGSRFFDTEASAQAAAQVDPLASQMMVNPSTVYVPETTTVFRTGDPGGPAYRYNANAAALAATIPGAVIFSSTGRGFVLDELITTPEHFGAVGDGVANDTVPMQRLAAYINWRGFGVVACRPGGVRYLVGKQAAVPPYIGQQVLNFTNLRSLTIIGNGAEFKNAESLRYGSFDPATGQRYDPPAGGFSTAGYSAPIGHILAVTSCSKVAIDGLKINGNNAGVILGGYFGDKGYQIPGDCLRVTLSGMVRLSNLELISAPHDNLYLNCNGNVKFTTTNELDARLTADNVFCDLAGRQGMSITGGSGMVFTNCSFNRSGQGAIQSPPMAGCDIEPVDRWASNITFNQCQFVANGGVALINDSGATGKVTVNSSEIWGGFDGTQGGLKVQGGHAILVDHDGWTFNDCRIHGSCPTLEDDTVFNNCTWDCATHPVYGPSGTNVAYLINSGGGMFYDSTFEIPVGRSVPILTAARPGRVAVNCTFNYGGNVGDVGIGTLGNRTFQDCNFVGTRPIDGSAVRPAWNTGGAAYTPVFRGNNTVSGMCSVSNIVDGEIPETFTPQTRKLIMRASDATITNNILYTDEYRAILPTAGYYRTGSIVRNVANAPGAISHWECVADGAIATVAWAASTTYKFGDLVLNDSGKTYVATKAGVSASSGGPTGLSAAITDGSVTWRYYPAPVWQPYGFDVPGLTSVAVGAANVTITAASTNTQRWKDAFGANKSATIAVAGVLNGRRYRFVRAATATGAFVLNIIYNGVTLKALNAGEWTEVEYSAPDVAFVVVASGTL